MIPITEVPADESDLYAARKKIQPRSIKGRFNSLRWAMVWITQLVFYGLPWLPWNGRQAVLFDLVERKFYIFGLVLWPQDVVYLTLLLIISALGLFLVTAVAGRVWCGYACPQSVYTEIFMWIERHVEGDRSARMKLDAASMSLSKFGRRLAKHGIWAALALWTGFTFVGFFSPIQELAAEVGSFGLGPWEAFWMLFYAAFTYLFAGHMREQVCKYMCPYARFQGVMFDPDTLIVSYDANRGEPRGSKKKAKEGQPVGDCVDCDWCVQVCPTGIDIRNGLQYECIGCALCIDACDQVMDKVGRPRGLIAYSTERAQLAGKPAHEGWREVLAHVLRPRVILYTSLLLFIVSGFAWALLTRTPVKMNVMRDRASLAREVEGGKIENVYQLRVMNTSESPRRFVLDVEGLPGATLPGLREIEVEAAGSRDVALRVQVDADSLAPGSHTVYFNLQAVDAPDVRVHEKSSFLQPR
ncbi:cytochrome c oxidase accessory protein CcoG [Methyloversatilis sp.]|uniref:cytochrome c oxidase accessory protein CcoG n=1 Tax=Methyloversatilis sp. TaxID=2569862 RepID=UPI0027365D9E|nr:cytochrome c oxidase accessory protein CcoG [Methyloversatilis sp.]MDP2869415.1 cytochrome c oxidase accessory protein CcoG [Methyloversatilis sp.]MDP3457614.1 cytochrome c oxidase accessory protein CcoG [Methyloversatilis sp.]MDP3577299.1 cytochrome c oxidase accessory protein CcoG [Methyloversatilis sp.]